MLFILTDVQAKMEAR